MVLHVSVAPNVCKRLITLYITIVPRVMPRTRNSSYATSNKVRQDAYKHDTSEGNKDRVCVSKMV